LEPVQQFEQEHSRCVGDDVFDISKDHSTESCSSLAWAYVWQGTNNNGGGTCMVMWRSG